MVIYWKDLGTVTVAGEYRLADGSIVSVTEEEIQTALEIIAEGTEPFVTLIDVSGFGVTPKRYRLGKFN